MGISYAKDAFRGRPFFVLFLLTGFVSRDFWIYRIFDIETGFDSMDFGIYRIGRSSFNVYFDKKTNINLLTLSDTRKNYNNYNNFCPSKDLSFIAQRSSFTKTEIAIIIIIIVPLAL
jgi:hypothetical protein